MGREENVIVFKDTENLVKTSESLKKSVHYSVLNQSLYLEIDSSLDEENVLEKHNDEGDGADVIISKKRTYEAASAYKDMKTCVLNFASASNPGGGVVKGSSAQEECLCRCSTLYFCLNTSDNWQAFYGPHRAVSDPIHNGDIIYTPNVCVFKTDTASPKLMTEADWYSVNVITCAAPNLRLAPSNGYNSDGAINVKVTDEELYKIHEYRFERILKVAHKEGNEAVILGAFGCGAFENNPEVVARAAKKVVDKYKGIFKAIEFAIYCSPRDEMNYNIFKKVFS